MIHVAPWLSVAVKAVGGKSCLAAFTFSLLPLVLPSEQMGIEK